jgi:hypothetical protein
MPFTTSYFAIDYSDAVRAVAILQTVEQFAPETMATYIGGFRYDQGMWGRFMCEGLRATSLAYNSPEASWLIGDRGEVWSFKAGQVVSKAQLPDSGLEGRSLGQPNEIRRVAGRLYVCGFAGQVYTQDAQGQWVHMDDGLAEPEGRPDSIDLESIDGTGPDNLYTVGSSGLMAHWDGRAWKRIPLLTNVYLARVRCFGERVIAVGDKGVVVEGDGTQWRVSHIPGAEEASLSDVALYNRKLYVAGVDTLWEQEPDGGWSAVKHGLPKEKTTFVRLAVGDGRLWAMGFKRLNSFDGSKWVAHPDPNNG